MFQECLAFKGRAKNLLITCGKRNAGLVVFLFKAMTLLKILSVLGPDLVV